MKKFVILLVVILAAVSARAQVSAHYGMFTLGGRIGVQVFVGTNAPFQQDYYDSPTANVSVDASAGSAYANGSAWATIVSSNDTSAVVSGGFSLEGSNYEGQSDPYDNVWASGNANLGLLFHTSCPAQLIISGSLSTSGSLAGTAGGLCSASLQFINENIFIPISGFNNYEFVYMSIVIPAGSHTGNIEVEGEPATQSEGYFNVTPSYTMNLTVVADCNCSYVLSATNAACGSRGTNGAVSVTTSIDDCSWLAYGEADWLNITGSTYGTGNGVVTYSVAANPTPLTRSGSFNIAGQSFTVTQSGAPVASMLSVRTNRFGFNINWGSATSVVVETCTNLANASWTPLYTNTLASGSVYFSDPQFTNYARRYYRLRSP